MSKTTVLAAALIGAGLGFDMAYTSSTEDTSGEEDIKLYEEVVFYAPFAAAMVEAAYAVTFDYPDEWKWGILKCFGEAIGDHSSTSNTDEEDDTSDAVHNLPDRQMMLGHLENIVYNEFVSLCVDTQQASLKDAIAQARRDTA